jgi:hypothetical protein
MKPAIARLIRRERDDSEYVAVDRQNAWGDLPAIARAKVLKIPVRDHRPVCVLGEFAEERDKFGRDYTMLQRNPLYTGVTRGKKLVVMVGQKKAVAIAVRNVSGRRRWSKLNEWLASRTVSTPIR